MIKVLHLTSSLNTGGAQIVLSRLVARSDRTRFQHVVVSLLPPGPVAETIAGLGIPVHTAGLRIPVHFLGLRGGVLDPRAIARLSAILRQERPDVMQTWMYHADLMGTLTAAPMRLPVAWNIRGLLHQDKGVAVRLVAKLCAALSRLPAAVVTNSEAGREQHAALGYRPRRWVHIPNGFDLDEFVPDPAARLAVRRELGLPADVPLIGLVARFHPQKDHRTFLRAAGLLSQQHPDVHFVLIGHEVTSSNATLQRWIDEARLGRQMHLLGERADIPTLTAAFDIATSASAFGEGFPNVVGEAMACGVPCVVTDVADSALIVGDTGLVVPAGDAGALAAASKELLELGPAGRQDLGMRARARVETHFGLTGVVRQYEDLYEQLSRPHAAIVAESAT